MQVELRIHKKELCCTFPESAFATSEQPELWLEVLKLLKVTQSQCTLLSDGRFYFQFPISRRLKRFISRPDALHLKW